MDAEQGNIIKFPTGVDSYSLQVPPWVSGLTGFPQTEHNRVIPVLLDTPKARGKLIEIGFAVNLDPPASEIKLSDGGAKGYIGGFVSPLEINTFTPYGCMGNFISDSISRNDFLRSDEEGLGAIYFGSEGGIVTQRSYHWWDPAEKPLVNEAARTKMLQGERPSYAFRYIPISRIGLEEERSLFVDYPWKVQSVGFEAEMFSGINYGGQFSALDSRTLIAYHKELGIPTSVEGAANQIEFPARERQAGEKPSEYRRRAIHESLAFVKVARALGIYAIPLSITPESANGGFAWPHLESAHVVNVGQSIGGLESPLTLDEIAEHLRTATQVNGLHITVACTPNPDGYIGAERVASVFNLTHGRILPVLKILTHSGNCGSIQQLIASAEGKGMMSHREEQIYDGGNGISTAKVGPVARFDDPEVLEAFINGATPNLERAALKDGEGNAGRCAHNRLGRPREWGGVETTIFDTEGNQNKIDAMATLIAVFTTSVEKALLVSETGPDGIPILLRSISEKYGFGEEYLKTFLGIITDHDEFLGLVGNVDKSGGDARINLLQNGDDIEARELASSFFNWVQIVGTELNLVNSEMDEITGHFDYLQRVVDPGNYARTYEEYYGLQGEPMREGGGNIAIVANERYRYLRATTTLTDQEIFNQILGEHANAYYLHLESLSK